VIKYFKTLLFILFMLSVGFTWRYEYWLLYHLSYGVLFVLAMFIAFTFLVGFYLKDSTNVVLRAIGEVYEKLFQYTALAQGVFYTTLVFYVVGTVVDGEVPLPDFDRQFMFEWMFGSNYATVLVYGALLCMLLFFQRLSAVGYLLTLLIAVVGVGVPVLFFSCEDQVKTLHAKHGALFVYAFIFSQLALSATSMHAMISEIGNKTVKVNRRK
jgi:hypothetical protein